MEQISVYQGEIMAITSEQMKLVDELMENKYGINLFQMMENAGRALAILSKSYFMDGLVKGKKIAVLAGSGGNGGGVLTAARRLTNWGANVSVFVPKPPSSFKDVTFAQLNTVKRMGIPVFTADTLKASAGYDLVLDGIFGYSLKNAPVGPSRYMIEWANNQRTVVLSLDVPSGMELMTSVIHQPTIKAEATLTIAFPKDALLLKEAADYTGKLFLADISVPKVLYNELNLPGEIPDYFEYSDIVQII
jgi:NAD(P)H-hydrate epimerase